MVVEWWWSGGGVRCRTVLAEPRRIGAGTALHSCSMDVSGRGSGSRGEREGGRERGREGGREGRRSELTASPQVHYDGYRVVYSVIRNIKTCWLLRCILTTHLKIDFIDY